MVETEAGSLTRGFLKIPLSSPETTGGYFIMSPLPQSCTESQQAARGQSTCRHLWGTGRVGVMVTREAQRKTLLSGGLSRLFLWGDIRTYYILSQALGSVCDCLAPCPLPRHCLPHPSRHSEGIHHYWLLCGNSHRTKGWGPFFGGSAVI